MLLVGLLGFAAFTLVSFAVGFRLLWLGRRTGGLPELAIGGSFVLAGGISGVLGVVVRSFLDLPDGAVQIVLGLANLALLLGVSLLALFTWRVFRREAPWAATLFCVCIASFAISFLGKLATRDFETTNAFEWIGLAGRIVVYTWGIAESYREYLAASRRAALGIGHPLVANRFLLWTVGLGAVLAIWLHAALRMATGAPADSDWLVIAGLGFVCAGALWLAFFPPASYQRRFTATRA